MNDSLLKKKALESQLRWRSRRRGMLELDLLLGDYFDARWKALSEEDQRTYVRLLEETDGDLWSWFNRSAVPEDAAFAKMVEDILDRVQPD